MSIWRAGWEAFLRAHHGITFFWGIDVVMAIGGGFLGDLRVPANASILEQAVSPAVGTVLGIIAGVLLIFLMLTLAAAVRQGITVMVTNIVTQTSIQNNVIVAPAYPTPVVMSDMGEGLCAFRYLLKRGAELEPDVSPTGEHQWGWPQLEYWTQKWLDYVANDVWKFMPDQATYIMNDDNLHIQDAVLKYSGWKSYLAVRRVVFDYRFGRLREICSQIPELRREDSQPEEA